MKQQQTRRLGVIGQVDKISSARMKRMQQRLDTEAKRRRKCSEKVQASSSKAFLTSEDSCDSAATEINDIDNLNEDFVGGFMFQEEQRQV